MVADPFHLLDCSMTSEGGCGIVLTSSDRAMDCSEPVWVLGGATDSSGPPTRLHPLGLQVETDSDPAGEIGARALASVRDGRSLTG